MTYNALIEISPQRIADIMSTGLEGGYSPWLQSAYWTQKPEGYVDTGITPVMTEGFYCGEFRIEFTFDDPDEEEGTFTGKKVVGPYELRIGIQLMAEKASRHFSDWMQENDDAETGDVFLQFLILGEIVYG
jgi:hypothetical protein